LPSNAREESKPQPFKIQKGRPLVVQGQVGQASACLLLVFLVLGEVKTRQAEACPTRTQSYVLISRNVPGPINTFATMPDGPCQLRFKRIQDQSNPSPFRSTVKQRPPGKAKPAPLCRRLGVVLFNVGVRQHVKEEGFAARRCGWPICRGA
jgi:hypothetical protein